ncbi:MAG: hypothetical protein RLZZ297_890 [Chloroflexota bacterium]
MSFRTALVSLCCLAACSAPPPSLAATPTPPTATATATHTHTPTRSSTVTPLSTVTPTSTPSPTAPLTQLRLSATSLPTTTYRYVFPIPDTETAYGPAHHDYMATDIFCPEGSPFVAVTDGVVEGVIAVDMWDASTDDPALRSGLAVGIIGADGVRYYGSHLSAVAPGIAPGVTVTAGQLLGYTGKSGNAAATPPHLHFGISRPSIPDDWQIRRGEMDPYPFLRAWQAGTALQPVFGAGETP